MKLKKGDKIFYRGAYNHLPEESTGRVLKVHKRTGLLYIEIDYPTESESGLPCSQWVHPCQCKKLKDQKRK